MGKVFIVGAGIGGIEYLTLKAYKILTKAEVLIYDALADAKLLQLVPKTCKLINVGKRGGQDSITQSEINQILVKECQQGRQVVRLKSGDPMIFGRTVSEVTALYSANCEFEIVAGISSAIAAPMLAGIPLTDNDLSPCFTVLTGHDLEILPWQGLGQMPTLVILMGTANLSSLLEKLKMYKSVETAIAIIQWAGRTNQQIWTGTLGDIQLKLPTKLSPAIIVVGDVVKHHEWMYQPIKRKPLEGKRILVTRAEGQSSQFKQLLEDTGAEVIEMPTLVISPPDSWESLDRAIAQIQIYDWLILTSANAVEFFCQRLHAQNLDTRSLHHLKIAVVGRKTAESLSHQGIIPDLIPPDFIADSLAANFPDCEGLNILFPRVQSGGREVLIAELEQKGAKVNVVSAYESGCPQEIDELAVRSLRNHQIDILTFASSKTVKHFHQLLCQVEPQSVWTQWLLSVQIASIGTQTSIACRELLGRVDIEAEEFTLEGLVKAISFNDDAN
jgi:uroporphyrinogen III methyltransferase / synthase